LSPQSNRKISEGDLNWADITLVMESDHKSKIRKLYPHLDLTLIQVLDIPDDYEFMDEELIEILTTKINALLETHFEG